MNDVDIQSYPLTAAQQGIWLLQKLHPRTAFCNVGAYVEIEASLDLAAFEEALRQVVSDTECLHVRFSEDGSEVRQHLGQPRPWELSVVDLTGTAAPIAAAEEHMQEDLGRYRDPTAEKLFGFTIFELGEGRYLWYQRYHHLIVDGATMGTLSWRVASVYAAITSGGRAAAAPRRGLSHLVESDQAYRASDDFEKDRQFWLRTLAGRPRVQGLSSRSPAGRASSRVIHRRSSLPPTVDRAIDAFCEARDLLRSQVLVAASIAYYHLVTGETDCLTAMHVTARVGADTRTPGMFANILPLRIALSPEMTFEELCQRVAREIVRVLPHQRYRFEEMKRDLNMAVHERLFGFGMNVLPAANPIIFEGKPARSRGLSTGPTGEFFFYAGGTGTDLGAEANAGLYTEDDLAGHLHRFERLLLGIAENPKSPLKSLPFLPDAELDCLLHKWNETAKDYPREQTVQALFESRAARTPDATAVVHRDREMTYAELNAAANRLAHHLIGLGIRPDHRVALCVDRGIDMVVALLAVLKAGGCYVPLDPSHPPERLAFMVSDSDSMALLTNGDLALDVRERLAAALPLRETGDTARVIDLADDRDWRAQSRENPRQSETGLTSEHLAYVIYTSGSTGKPKGVMVEHRSLTNVLWSFLDTLGLGPSDSTLAVTTVAFDIAGLEIYMPLISGGRLILSDREEAGDPRRLAAALEQRDITFMQATPATWRMLLEAGWRGAPQLKALCGGEALSPELAGSLRARVAGLWNVYGPTETTIWSTMQPVIAGPRQVATAYEPIGRPIANTKIYLLHRNGSLVPAGAIGELCIGGDGVARGYVGDPSLTASRFLSDPFHPGSEARIYRTGDLARYLPDGSLEFIGREDDQVKIRGFRVELGEVAARLREQPGVHDAVVLADDDGGDLRLIAYVKAASEESNGEPSAAMDEVSAEALRSRLLRVLPSYMVPAVYVRMNRWPLTANGKIDRKALPRRWQRAKTNGAYEAPVGDIEVSLARIWCELLKLDRVGRRDNFFDLGGHSLTAVKMTARVQALTGKTLELAEVFEFPRLDALAAVIGGSRTAELRDIVPAPKHSLEPLSFGQQRLWLLSQIEGGSHAYHVASGFRLRGPLNRSALRRALDRLVARHEILRTNFVSLEGRPMQIVQASTRGVQWDEVDGRPWTDPGAQCAREAKEEAAREFNLESGRLFRARLIQLAEEDHVLLLTLHHVVCDGWSMNILAQELAAIYPAFCQGALDPLPEPRLQYRDYAIWQRELVGDGTLRSQGEYWREALRGIPSLLELPLDRPRPKLQKYAAAYIDFALDAQTTAGLLALSQRHGITVYGTILAAWSVVLSRLSGQADIVIGSAIANRSHPDVERIVGFVANTVAMRLDLSGDPTIEMLLAQAKGRVVDAQRHQDLPFEQVVELINPPRSAAHAPIFQVGFAWQQGNGELTLPGLSVNHLPVDYPSGKFDLTLELHERGDRITGGMHYASSLFDATTIERHLDYLRNVIHGCLADDRQSVSKLSFLPEAERHRLLHEWNATEMAYPRDKATHALFEDQVARTPDAIAVVCEDQFITYAELNTRANRLAHHLRTLGVRPDSRVALCMERSIDMVVCMLATWKAGGCYVPLDPSHPRERLAFMIADSAPVALLTHALVPTDMRLYLGARVRARAAEAGHVAWMVDMEDAARWQKCSPVNPRASDIGLTPDHLAYLMYTSGSTGTPKGVMVEHNGVVSVLCWTQKVFAFGPRDAMLQKTPFGFDASVWEIFWPIMAGARLVMAKPGGHKDPDYLAKIVREQGITALQFVPSMLELFLRSDDVRHCTSLVSVFCGAERLSAALVARFYRMLPHATLYNLYGPTEASCNVTILPCAKSGDPVDPSVGRPVANRRIYILDSHLAPVPTGAAGEIYIGGIGVARAYLNLPELTAERFIQNPFAPDDRLYRTGDLGRYRADGNIDFVGRTDAQIKISGFRVEVGEIETRLRHHPDIDDAVVQLEKSEDGDARLIAYYLRSNAAREELSSAALRAHLAEFLPSYMIPSLFVLLERFPLTPNGKLDRKALSAARAEIGNRGGEQAPQGALEEGLASIFSEVLGREQVGRCDDFFMLGGTSIQVFRVLSQIKSVFGLKVSVDSFFGGPTVELVARAMSGLAEARESSPAQFVALKEGEHDAPVMLMIHPLGGEIECYRGLAQQVTGEFHIEALAGRGASLESIASMEEMVQTYAALIADRYAGRTLLLLGWSYGGILALLIANALARKLHVAEVLLVDALVAPEGMSVIPHFGLLALTNALLMQADRAPLWVPDLAPLGTGKPDLMLWREVVKEHRGFEIPIDNHEIEELCRKAEHHHALLANRKGPWPEIASRVTTVWGSRSLELAPKFDWRAFGGVAGDEHIFDADHYSLLRRPELVEIIAERLEAQTRAAAAQQHARHHAPLLSHWRQLNDAIYAQPAGSPSDFDIAGWNSSYTGMPISDRDMRLWVEHTVEHLRGLRPRRVLEIGCGTGLLLTRLAPSCQQYLAIDFSAAVLERLARHCEQRDDLGHVVLKNAMAHQLDFIQDEGFDLVILNSVVQYFPDLDYLLQVLQQSLRVTSKTGTVFLGDIRSLPLLEAFHASVQLHKAKDDVSIDDLRLRARQASSDEQELLVHPMFFDELAHRWPKLGSALFSPKLGHYDNELSRFRYDVTLRLGPRQAVAAPPRWLPWDEQNAFRQPLCDALSRGTPIGLRAVRDGRAAPFVEAARLLHASDPAVHGAAQLRERCARISGLDPNTLVRLAHEYNVPLCWLPREPGLWDVIFAPQWRDIEPKPEPGRAFYGQFANTPNRAPAAAPRARGTKAGDPAQGDRPYFE